jgi:Cu/Ag efflux protein CusF
MNQRRIKSAIVLGSLMYASFALLACNSTPQAPAAQTNPASQSTSATQSSAKRYELKGKVVSIDKKAKEIEVDGEDIPGFMGAMTMGYPVKDEKLLDQVKPGDEIKSDLISDGGTYWLENIVVTKKKP